STPQKVVPAPSAPTQVGMNWDLADDEDEVTRIMTSPAAALAEEMKVPQQAPAPPPASARSAPIKPMPAPVGLESDTDSRSASRRTGFRPRAGRRARRRHVGAAGVAEGAGLAPARCADAVRPTGRACAG